MPGVTASLAVALSARLTKAAVGGGTPQYNAAVDYALALSPGTAGVDEADLLYHATLQLAASANADLDLAGALADALGTTIAAAEVVAIIIEADEGNTNTVRVGPAAAAGALLGFADASDRVGVAPGGILVLTNPAGWAVTATSADLINVANSAGGSVVDYTITLIGRTVAA
jgi:hypothetical protein